MATFLGGVFALRFRDKLHLILGFSAGAVIGVAFFDLLPEAIELAGASYKVSTVTFIAAIGFVLYMIADRFFFAHHHGVDRTSLGAGSLVLHSLLDGIAIGLAFQVSTAVGLVVAIAVLAHDFSDGINTVGMIMRGNRNKNKDQNETADEIHERNQKRKRAYRWLVLDALAPVVGIFLTLFISVSSSTLGIIIALFCGFFLYIGASDLLPESHHGHPTVWTTCMTILGVVVLYGAVTLARI